MEPYNKKAIMHILYKYETVPLHFNTLSILLAKDILQENCLSLAGIDFKTSQLHISLMKYSYPIGINT